MAITSNAELVTAVGNWLERSDLSSRIPEFIALGEAWINRKLRVRTMETTASVSTVAGTATAALPTGYLAGKRLFIDGDPRYTLTYVTPEQVIYLFPSADTGKPRSFTVEEGNFRFFPTPDAVYTVSCLYWKRLTALSSSVNDVFTNNPDLWLYASLAAAYGYLMEDSEQAKYDTLATRIIDEISRQDVLDRHSGSLLVMRSDTGAP